LNDPEYPFLDLAFGSFKNEGNSLREALLRLLLISVTPQFPGAPDFQIGELKSPLRLSQKLRHQSDPVSKHLWMLFTDEHRKYLVKHELDDASGMVALVALVAALNEVIRSALIYETSRFAAVKLSSRSSHLLKEDPSGEILAWLNRFLLEDAYPDEIDRRREFTPRDQFTCRQELLRTAIFACNLLAISSDWSECDSILAPMEEGWPVVLAAGKARAGEWKNAKDLIAKLRAGKQHPARNNFQIGGIYGNFVNHWIWVASRTVKGREPYELSSSDWKELPGNVEQCLTVFLGVEWHAHPAIDPHFAGRFFSVGGRRVRWGECQRWEKRDVVRDKFEAAARTIIRRLNRKVSE